MLGFVPIVRGLNPAIVWRAHSSMVGPSCHYARSIAGRTQVQKRTSLYVAIANNDGNLDQPLAAAFESIVNGRYACTRFRRHVEQDTPDEQRDDDRPRASASDMAIVREAVCCLDLARRAPSGFNSQPYRIVLVSEPAAKEVLASSCHGRNADRVRDSDCTAVFLADREWGRDLKRYGTLLADKKGRRPMGKWMRRKAQGLVMLFSSGYPLPRIFASPLSFVVRSISGIFAFITRRRILIPTLSSAETWATKNTMLVAMTYMLAASSRGLVTCPMEGYWAAGIRRALGIPGRFAIPLIVSTGTAYHHIDTSDKTAEESDDAGMAHGTGPGNATPRYLLSDVIFQDSYGKKMGSVPS